MSAEPTQSVPGPASAKRRWPRDVALDVARELLDRLKPHCDRLVVAGSLRRRKPDVGDVEILYIPCLCERRADLFSTLHESLADEEIHRMLGDGTLAMRPSKTGVTSWGEWNKLAVHRSGVPVDLFRTRLDSWWNYLVCRTGPAASNARIAMEAQRRGYKWNPYGSGFTHLNSGTLIPMPSEEAVFAFVGLPFVQPWERQ